MSTEYRPGGLCARGAGVLPWAWHACGIIWERQLNRVRRKMCDAFQPVVVHNIMVPCALPKKNATHEEFRWMDARAPRAAALFKIVKNSTQRLHTA